jgi:hypothetical protein
MRAGDIIRHPPPASGWTRAATLAGIGMRRRIAPSSQVARVVLLPERRMKDFARGSLVFLLLVLACSSPRIRPLSPEEVLLHLPRLVDGQTTKEEVLLHLGIPSAQFQGETILTYQMRRAADGQLHVVSRLVGSSDPRLRRWPPGTYDLVLVFGADHVLARHALLLVE